MTSGCLKAGSFLGSGFTTNRGGHAFRWGIEPKPRLMRAAITWWQP